MIHCYVASGEKTSPKWCHSFAQGCDGEVSFGCRLREGDVAMFGSLKLKKILDQARAENRNFYYGDHAYFRRWKYCRVTKNGFQHTGDGKATPQMIHRFNTLHIGIQPWRTEGKFILLCPPDRHFAAFHDFDVDKWRADTFHELARHSNLPILIRDRRERKPLASALRGCWCLVTHESNSAVEAIINGVPAIVTGSCAARSMAGTDLSQIADPPTPVDRERWAAVLAANQWTLNEMQTGVAWNALNGL